MDKGIGAVLIVFILTGCMAQYQEEDMTEGEQMTDLVGYWEGAIEVPNPTVGHHP